MKRYALLALFVLLTVGAVQQVTIIEYKTPSGALCFGAPQPFDCEFPPAQVATVTIGPRATQTPTATFAPPTVPPGATATPFPPLLVNGDFEQPNNAAWTFFNLWRDTPSTNDERGDPLTRINGAQSFRIWNNFRCIMAGVYQRVVVAPFTTLEFSAWGRTWASEGVFPEGHDPNVYDAIAVGIDPNGGTSPESSGVIWNENFSTDNGKRLFIRATALSSQVTVFIRARVGVVDPNGTACQWPHTHMMAFIDGAEIVQVGVAAKPEVTQAVMPVVLALTSTPTVEPPPTEPAPSPYPQPSGYP